MKKIKIYDAKMFALFQVLNIPFYLSIEDHLSVIEGLYRSIVVHNILVGPVLQSSELGELGRGDGDWLDEVDPVHYLHAPRGGQGARVGAEGCVLHISYQVSYLRQNYCKV